MSSDPDVKTGGVSQASSPNNEAASAESEKAQAEQEYLHGLPLYLLIISLVLTVLIMALDISIVATAIPRITDTFDTISDIGWYGAAFIFTNSALQPMSGKIYTFFPMKQSFIIFIAVFELGSLLCATAVSSPMFIIGRAVAGLGSSGLVNGALSIVALAGPPDKRPLFMAIVMAVASAGQILGPLIGGALTEHASWRWCFYINLPCGAVTVAFLTFISFPNNASARKKFVPKSMIKDFDIIGFILFVPAIIMFMMALQWGGTTYAWSSATIIGLLVGFFVALFPLIYWEYRQGNDAMFPFPILRIRVVACACMTGFLAGGSLLLLAYYLPLWFQTVKLANSFHSAIDTLPSFLSQILLAIVSGVLCPRVIPYFTPFAITGAILCTIGSGLMTTFHPNTPIATWIGFQIVFGAGRGLFMQIPVQTAQQHIPKDQLAVGTAVVSFFQFFGGSIFLALGQTTFSNLLKPALGRFAPGLDPSVVLGSGATDVRGSVPGEYARAVVLAYNEAITKTYYLAVGMSAVCIVSAMGLGWRKVEKKAKAKGVKSPVELEKAVGGELESGGGDGGVETGRVDGKV
ncbi:hypothetical protein LTR70_001534 [Exophiala xenobiotica]|uniref:Major facilitator superfamily (MFS) profile domain-containing protein n=1 Tax=Lithohypha guttulata TaxID=1690604 RepID=A0ABR0K7G1_9EURO|nr:hypothetical protein LTR24_005945 [Lithohypha guttulata]KAK5327911.1 hypothetical protein LTR70_001534 [Exophiala xenobiotica]